MKLQSQPNFTDTELVQNVQKHSAPILSATHSKGVHKYFHVGCVSKGCCQQVSEGVSDMDALACEHRETFSGHKSMLNSLYSNSLLM